MAPRKPTESKLVTTTSRTASIDRKTGETAISLSIDLDGQGVYEVDTGNVFLDHMVSQISRHSMIDITLNAHGDLHTGWHHLVEDVAITLGRAFTAALGDARGLRRVESRADRHVRYLTAPHRVHARARLVPQLVGRAGVGV